MWAKPQHNATVTIRIMAITIAGLLPNGRMLLHFCNTNCKADPRLSKTAHFSLSYFRRTAGQAGLRDHRSAGAGAHSPSRPGPESSTLRATLPTPSEEDEMNVRQISRGLEKARR
jgi:hypothetical protein